MGIRKGSVTVKAEDRPSGLAGDSASVITFLFRLQPGLVEWRVLVAAARQRRRSRIKTVTYFYGHSLYDTIQRSDVSPFVCVCSKVKSESQRQKFVTENF